MPLKNRAIYKLQNFNLPLSYLVNEGQGFLRSCANVIQRQNRLDTRPGKRKFILNNLDGPILSLSYFKKTDGTQYWLAKVGSSLYSISPDGANTLISSTLSASGRHDGLTFKNRHIIADSTGYYSFDGSTLSNISAQAVPSRPTLAAAAGGQLEATTFNSVVITFYSSTTGYESNPSPNSTVVTTTANQKLTVSDIPATATMTAIDKVRIYLKQYDSGDYVFSKEISLGTTSSDITDNPLSEQTPPDTSGSPPSNCLYLALFNNRVVVAGISGFLSDVRFSEQYQPEAFDETGTSRTLFIDGNGPITGLGVGFYNNSVLDPYLVIFKKTSTSIYSEINGNPKLVNIDSQIGCVSHKTIRVKNGNVYFLSTNGWRVISNGNLIDSKGKPATLGDGKIDDIFKNTGFYFDLDIVGLENAHSVYYSTMDHYITFVPVNYSNDRLDQAYSYNFEINGFTRFTFSESITASCIAEDSSEREIILMGDTSGCVFFLKHDSTSTDHDTNGNNVAFEAHAHLAWLDGGDMNKTYDFRDITIKAIASSNAIDVKYWTNFLLNTIRESELDVSSAGGGFVFDEAVFDEAVFDDARTIVTSTQDLNQMGESILIGFYQTVLGGNIGLISAQVDFNSNNNRNKN